MNLFFSWCITISILISVFSIYTMELPPQQKTINTYQDYKERVSKLINTKYSSLYPTEVIVQDILTVWQDFNRYLDNQTSSAQKTRLKGIKLLAIFIDYFWGREDRAALESLRPIFLDTIYEYKLNQVLATIKEPLQLHNLDNWTPLDYSIKCAMVDEWLREPNPDDQEELKNIGSFLALKEPHNRCDSIFETAIARIERIMARHGIACFDHVLVVVQDAKALYNKTIKVIRERYNLASLEITNDTIKDSKDLSAYEQASKYYAKMDEIERRIKLAQQNGSIKVKSSEKNRCAIS